jgi:hypothetical protein
MIFLLPKEKEENILYKELIWNTKSNYKIIFHPNEEFEGKCKTSKLLMMECQKTLWFKIEITHFNRTILSLAITGDISCLPNQYFSWWDRPKFCLFQTLLKQWDMDALINAHHYHPS